MEENGNKPIDEDALSDFRNQWRQELAGEGSSSRDTKQDEEDLARSFFLQGVDLEKKGKCFEAIRLYRRAIQLVPDIEFKAYTQTLLQKQQASEDSSNNNPAPSSSSQPIDPGDYVEDLVEAFQRDLSIDNKRICESSLGAGTITTSVHISALPVEVFLLILKWLVGNDLDFKSLEKFGQVCKGFYLLTRDQEIWRLACIKVWGANVSPPVTSWREMFLTRTRVNFNGCYISKINYQRYGENSFQDTFYRPVQIVEYFRLIRFLPNGTMLMMTSADELQVSVNKLKNVQQALQSRDILKGRYHYQDSTVLIMIKKQQNASLKFKRKPQIDSESLNFFLELEITGTPKRKFNKLMWKHYSISQFRNDEELSTDFDLRSSTKYPSFYFSQVKSFHAVSNECLQAESVN